jgi:VWFA-related protein
VSNLKQADFSVQDAGKPRSIDTFVSPQARVVAPQLEANEYSNAPDANEAGAIFVVFDTIHTRFIEERDMREMVMKFLGRAAQAKRAVALAILNDKGLHIYHSYQTSSNILLAALIKTGLGGLKGATPPPGVNDAEVSAEAARLSAFSRGDLSNATPQNQLLISNIDMPLMMFQEVARAAYGLPGRKALVWVTNAIPFDIDPKNFQFVSPKESNFGAAVNGAQTPGIKDALSGDQVKRLMPIWRHSMRDLLTAEWRFTRWKRRTVRLPAATYLPRPG